MAQGTRRLVVRIGGGSRGRLLDRVRALVHQRLVQEPRWTWPVHDPAGLRVTSGRFGPMLLDDYEAVSEYVVVLHGTQIRAVHRVSWPLDGRLPIERYGIRRPSRFGEATAVELSRLVADGRGVALVDLLYEEFTWLRTLGVRWAVSTAACPQPCALYRRLGMVCEGEVRYPGDAGDVCLLSADVDAAEASVVWKLAGRGRRRGDARAA